MHNVIVACFLLGSLVAVVALILVFFDRLAEAEEEVIKARGGRR